MSDIKLPASLERQTMNKVKKVQSSRPGCKQREGWNGAHHVVMMVYPGVVWSNVRVRVCVRWWFYLYLLLVLLEFFFLR